MSKAPVTEDVSVASLVEHPDNPRQGDVGAISTSIERFGVYQPIVVQRSTKRVLAGNHRLKAARALGRETIPVWWLDVDDDEARAILLADNRLSDLATYDEAQLLAVVRDVAERSTLDGTGWDGDDLDDLIKKLEGMPPEAVQPSEVVAGLAVIVTCTDEDQQRDLIERLDGEGYDVRAAVI